MANGKVNFWQILTLAFRELDVFSSLDHHQVVVGFCFVIFSAPLDFAPACCVLNNQEPSLGYTIPLSQKSRSGSDLFHISNLIENRGWTRVNAKFFCTHSTQIKSTPNLLELELESRTQIETNFHVDNPNPYLMSRPTLSLLELDSH